MFYSKSCPGCGCTMIEYINDARYEGYQCLNCGTIEKHAEPRPHTCYGSLFVALSILFMVIAL